MHVPEKRKKEKARDDKTQRIRGCKIPRFKTWPVKQNDVNARQIPKT